METMLESITDHAIMKIEELSPDNVYGCDLHHEVFNMDYFIIGRYQATNWLEENVGVFAAIEEIKEYEMDNFGEVGTDFSEPERVCNMYVYIKGEELLHGIDHLTGDAWDRLLTAEDIDAILTELKDTKL